MRIYISIGGIWVNTAKVAESPVIKNVKKTNLEKKSLTHRIGYGILYLSLIIVAVFQIFPIIWLFLFSLKNNQEVFNMSPFSLPESPKWENYEKVWTEGNISQYFLNSVTYTVVAIVLTVVLASMVTFAITRMQWKGSKLVLGLFMVGLMIPVHSTLIPLFNTYTKLHLIDNPLS